MNGLAETVSGWWEFPGRNGDEPLTRDDLCSFPIEARDAAAGIEGAFHGTGQEGAAGTFERDGLGGDGLVITKCGKPVAYLLPYELRHAELIGSLGHKVKVRGDIFSTGLEREAGAES
ncbi:MAG: hypothetical protein OXE86_08475 [Alphaproteobacteria bacterium]|nr:hypothetical protein [Alphaproteobacteria bacterium]